MKTRLLAALAVLVSGYVHLRLWFDWARDAHTVGPMFMLNAVAAVVIAVLLVLWRSWEPPLLAAGFGAVTIVAFILATTRGLYGVHEHWSGGYVWVAFVAEAVAVLAGLYAAWATRPGTGGPAQRGHRMGAARA